MQYFYDNFIYAFVDLFFILNPLGMSTVFLTMTRAYTPARRHQTAYRIALYSVILLVATFFFGINILNFFGITLPCVQVAGGILIFYTSWNMLYAQPDDGQAEQGAATPHEIAFFPLTMPITAGPGSLAITIALSARCVQANSMGFTACAGTLSAIFTACLAVALCYRFADSIFNRLGPVGTNVISKLIAFIVLAISVSVIWQGIVGLIRATF